MALHATNKNITRLNTHHLYRFLNFIRKKYTRHKTGSTSVRIRKFRHGTRSASVRVRKKSCGSGSADWRVGSSQIPDYYCYTCNYCNLDVRLRSFKVTYMSSRAQYLADPPKWQPTSAQWPDEDHQELKTQQQQQWSVVTSSYQRSQPLPPGEYSEVSLYAVPVKDDPVSTKESGSPQKSKSFPFWAMPNSATKYHHNLFIVNFELSCI